MTTINDIYVNALLADAAYLNGIAGLVGETLADAMAGRMTPEQAQYIGTNFTAVNQASGLSSSFEATVWRGNTGTPFAGRYYVSMRGTQEFPPDGVADLDLASSGLAHQQLADMVNWWLRETTPTLTDADTPAYATQISVAANGDFVLAAPVLGTGGLLNVGEIAAVNGHSLGGYLATAFTRVFGEKWPVEAVNTFNSAGFSRVAAANIESGFNQIAQLLGQDVGLSGFSFTQNNYYAQNGINVTTNTWNPIGFTQYGVRIGLFQEDLTGIINNHSMYKLTDMLALGNALARLDTTLDLTRLSTLVKAGSNQMIASYEGVLDGVRKQLLGANVIPTLPGDANATSNQGPQPDARLQFHANLKALTDGVVFQSLQGKVSISLANANLSSQAKTRLGFEEIAALELLSPIVLNAVGSEGAVALQALWQAAAWADKYQGWVSDKASLQSGSTANHYTDGWITDRAFLLQAIATRNQQDNTTGQIVDPAAPAGRATVFHFTDPANPTAETVLITQNRGGTGLPEQHMSFGNAEANVLTGFDNALGDHLYGGPGDDVIDGKGGSDYLEGNADADNLKGGSGADTLMGGIGSDTLDGGTGNDILEGGIGTDTYRFIAGDGSDRIHDSDGLGSIVVTGAGPIDGSNTVKLSATVWQTPDKALTYTLVEGAPNQHDLVVRVAATGNVITIQDWSTEKNLGISLPGTVTAPPPNPALSADLLKQNNGITYTLVANKNYVGAGSDPGAADVLNGSADDEKMEGLLGNDGLYGHDGDDRLDGNEGADLLMGGVGADVINGGDGNDVIFGSAIGYIATPSQVGFTPFDTTGSDVAAQGFSWVATRALLQPGQEGDLLLFRPITISGAITSPVWQEGNDYFVELDGNVIDGGAGDDYIAAGTGNDIVQGGTGNDDIIGMDKADLIDGGDGDDYMFGDGTQDQDDQGRYTLLEFHGADTMLGGDGHDIMLGQGAADELFGGDGNDKLWGDDQNPTETPSFYHGNDYVDGGEGDDDLVGGGRDDMLVGGAGNDRLWGDAGSPGQVEAAEQGQDYLDGGDDADWAAGGGNDDEVFGGDGNDTLMGDDVQAVLAVSQHGNDYVDGEGGDDLLAGDGGNDQMFGGDGNDQLWGDDVQSNVAASAHGHDTLDGEAGNDTVIGGGGNDELYGGEGNDLVRGDDLPANVPTSAHGNDALFGDAGDDNLFGGFGNDVIDGGSGNDGIAGDAGNDTISGGTGVDYMDGGDGNDVYRFALGDSVPNSLGQTDTVSDALGNNKVEIQGVTTGELQALANGGNLHLQYAGEVVIVVGGLAGGVSSYQIAGNTYSTSQLIGNFSPTPVVVAMPDGSNKGMGGTGSDQVTITSKGSALSGGLGNDTLSGSGGNNTYLYSAGDGTDTIQDTSPKNDPFTYEPLVNKLSFAEGIAPEDLTLQRQGNNLLVQVGTDAANTVVIANYSTTAAAVPVEEFVFADGTVWDRAAITMHIPNVLTQGDDNFQGSAFADVIDGLGGNDTLYAQDGDDSLTGGTGNDLLEAGNGNDTVDGSAGNDTLRGGPGADVYRFGIGGGVDLVDDQSGDGAQDVLQLGAGIAPADVLFLGGSQLRLTLPASGDEIQLGLNSNIERIEFAGGAVWTHENILQHAVADAGTEGNDNLSLFSGTAYSFLLDAKGGNDAVSLGGSGNHTLLGGAGNDNLSTGPGNDLLDGGSGNDLLSAGAGNDTLTGGETMYGGTGADRYVVTTWDPITIQEAQDTTSNADVLVLPANVLPADVRVERDFNTGTNGYDDLVLRTGAPGSTPITLAQFYFSQSADDYKIEQVQFANGTVWNIADLISRNVKYQFTAQGDVVLGYRWGETIDALGGADTVEGYFGNDSIQGGAGNDALYGDRMGYPADARDGNDTLDGGTGNDSLYGGGGNDTFVWGRLVGKDTVSDVGGTDTLALASGIATTAVTLWRVGQDLIVALDSSSTQLTVTGHFNGAGSELDAIRFADGTVWNAADIASRTTSGTANAMTGTSANNTFTVDNTGDTITEGVNQGTDTVNASVSYLLPDNVENITLTGFLNITATGNTLANVITGNTGDNVLRGGPEWMTSTPNGADTMAGGAGDDSYYVASSTGQVSGDTVDDVVQESAGAGYDTVYLWGYNYTLPANVEALVSLNTSVALLNWDNTYIAMQLTGNALDNVIDHSGTRLAPAVLDGGAGADTLRGGTQGDTYVVDSLLDVIEEPANSGAGDTVRTHLTYTLAANLENLTITGTAATTGTGNASANVFQASNGGANTLVGGLGNDSYDIDGSDTVVEQPGEGVDTVTVLQGTSGAAFSLAAFANIENMTLGDNLNAASITGNASDNVLTGNRSSNLLDGAGGHDYISDQPTAAAFDADTLLGGTGNDTLVAFAGADLLDGGAGDDRLINAGGAATLAFGMGGGADTLVSSLSYTALQVNLDATVSPGNLGVARDGADVVLTISANDSLRLSGFYVDATSSSPRNVLQQLHFSDGTVIDAATVSLVARGQLSLVASPGPDLMFGTAGNDTLVGSAGNDTMIGGAGADLYTYARGQGMDVIRDIDGTSSIDTLRFAAGIVPGDITVSRDSSGVTLTFDADEQVFLEIFGADLSVDRVEFNNGTVWTAADLNPVNNPPVVSGTLPALTAVETQAFSYVIPAGTITDPDAGDSVTYWVERADGTALPSWLTFNASTRTLSGTPSSTSSGDLALMVYGWDEQGLEAQTPLALSVLNIINGTSAANTLTGTSGRDAIYGLGGNDTISGAAGADLLVGGAGNDAYTVDAAGDVVQELAGEGTDAVSSSVTFTLADNVENLTLTGSSGIHGTGNASANAITGNTGNNSLAGAAGNDTLTGGNGDDTLDGGLGNDSMVGGAGNDVYSVDATADVVTEAASAGTDTVMSAVTLTIPANVEVLTLTGSANVNATGGTGNDVLNGNTGNNSLTGAAGNDTLSGGDGNDTLTGGAGVDSLTGGLGADRYTYTLMTESGITTTTRDVIVGFSSAQGDKIDLSAIDASTTVTGNQTFSFIGTAAFSAAGQVRFDVATQTLLASDDGDTAAELSIYLPGVTSLLAADIVL